MSYPSLTRMVKCRFCREELREKNYQNHLLRKHSNENASDERYAGHKTIFAYAKPPLNEVEKDLNENFPTCTIPSVSIFTNKDQNCLAFTEKIEIFNRKLCT